MKPLFSTHWNSILCAVSCSLVILFQPSLGSAQVNWDRLDAYGDVGARVGFNRDSDMSRFELHGDLYLLALGASLALGYEEEEDPSNNSQNGGYLVMSLFTNPIIWFPTSSSTDLRFVKPRIGVGLQMGSLSGPDGQTARFCTQADAGFNIVIPEIFGDFGPAFTFLYRYAFVNTPDWATDEQLLLGIALHSGS